MSKILEETAALEQKTEPVSGTKNSPVAESDERIVSGFKPADVPLLTYEEITVPEQKTEPVSGTKNSPVAESDERIVSGFKPAGTENSLIAESDERIVSGFKPAGIGNHPSQTQGANDAQLQATELHVKLVKKRSRKGVLIALVALIAVAGLGAAAYRLGVLEIIGGLEKSAVEDETEIPEGAAVPAFSPIDPADFASDADENFIVVPDETGLALPSFGHGPQITAEPMNYYTQTPNVSTFFTRAAQDESYVYFLQSPAATKYGLYKLMRANISTGKSEPAINSEESSVYSFVLYGQNIITCEHKADTDTFAFYRNPKSGEHAQLLFETDSPAYMNVFDNKIFMLFVEEQALGVFDLKTDTQPAYIALESLEETAHYFPQFSVVDGYLYYGIWYDTDADETQVSMEYLRRSLYTGESTTLLSCNYGDTIWVPCWDEEGNAYYAHHNPETMTFDLVAVKGGGSPQVISSFDSGEEWPSVAFKDEFFITALPDEGLRQYNRADFSVKLEASVKSHPFAATKDFLVAEDGLYRLFDFGFIEFE